MTLRTLAALLPVLAATAATAQTPVPTYLVIGQSNAEGYARVGTGPGELDPCDPLAQPQPAVQIFDLVPGNPSASRWEALHAGVNTQSSSGIAGRFGPEVSLGPRLASLHGGTVHLLKYAVGATFLAPSVGGVPQPERTWDPATGLLYPLLQFWLGEAETQAQALGLTLDVQAVLWVQGTNDAVDAGHAGGYGANLAAFLATLRGDLFAQGFTQTATPPVLLSQVPSFMYDVLPNSFACDGCHVDVVRAAEEAVACADPDVGLIDPSDLSVIGCHPSCDFVHFDAPGQLAHGERLFDALATLPCPSLTSSPGSLPILVGGLQTLSLDAGPAHAQDAYLVMGTTTGIEPGVPLPPFVLPLNDDGFYFPLTIQTANQGILVSTFGLLDANGRATAGFQLPGAVLGLPFLGRFVHHAFAVLPAGGGPVSFVSNATGLRFVL